MGLQYSTLRSILFGLCTCQSLACHLIYGCGKTISCWLAYGMDQFKPKMDTILNPVLEEIEHLNCLGLTVRTSNGVKEIRAMLLVSVFDLPAKAAAANMKQFNGRYGCLYCTHPGEALGRGATVYPPNTADSLQTHVQVQRCAAQAASSGKPVFGIKGPSPLAKYIDVVNSIPVDYMHAVLEGVCKQIMMSWFNSKNHKCSFYLGRKVQDIDRLLMKMKPPIEIHRAPRPIATTLKFWKATLLFVANCAVLFAIRVCASLVTVCVRYSHFVK